MTAQQQQEDRFEIAMVVTDNIRQLLTQSEAECDFAAIIPINDIEEARNATAELIALKRSVDRLKAERDGFTADARKIIERAERLFNPGIKRFEHEIAGLSSRLLTFETQQKARIERERAEREAAARKLQQEAEARAAAERAKGEEQARAARRKAEEAEAERVKAIEEGNANAAAKAAAAAAKHQEQANAAIENAEQRGNQLQMAAAASAPAPVESFKLDGFSSRENWKARLEFNVSEARALELVVAAIVMPQPAEGEFYDTSAFVRPDLLQCLKLDMPTIHKRAKAMKKLIGVPGFEAFDDRIAAGKRS